MEEDGVPEMKDMGFSQEHTEIEIQDKNPGGGVLSNFISAMVSKNDDKQEIKQEEEEDDEKGGGGGIFNNLISGILNHGGDGDNDGKHQENHEAEQGGGGGLINNLVSHLPSPLADDAAPAPDEASILIHSIVHD